MAAQSGALAAGAQSGAPASQSDAQPTQRYDGGAGSSGQDDGGSDGASADDVAGSGPTDPLYYCVDHLPSSGCESEAHCSCMSCQSQAAACLADVGCLAILSCEADAGCSDFNGCSQSCQPVLLRYPNSVAIAKGLNDCARSAGCTTLCGPPELPDAAVPPVEGDGGSVCRAPPTAVLITSCRSVAVPVDAGSCGSGCVDSVGNVYKSECGSGVCECSYNGAPTCTCSMPPGATCSSCCPAWRGP
jgi:hypothetical protein